MEQRVSVITLGVSDLTRARAFYDSLGWVAGSVVENEVVFYQTGGLVFSLWDRARLADDTGVTDPGGWGGITLAHNVRSPEEVDRVIAGAKEAGATISRDPAETFWGGYSGVFVDPDGHAWEVAHNPFWQISDDGSIVLTP